MVTLGEGSEDGQVRCWVMSTLLKRERLLFFSCS